MSLIQSCLLLESLHPSVQTPAHVEAVKAKLVRSSG